MRIGCMLACVIVIASCKEDRCERFAHLAQRCAAAGWPSETFDDMRMACFSTLQDRGSNARPDAYDECSRASTCAELNACFEKYQCKFVLTSPQDRTPSFMCYGAPP